MSLVQNEQTKLMANALDRASTACLTVGVLGPAAAYLYGISPGAGPASQGVPILFGSLFWLAAAAVLHYWARTILGRLI
ncbi:hypothetical protein GCM10007301_22100 [Azorhizobium oxalatiphilum]|uniref:Uncharacterized protein n=1 Tax=Azorhizobium oxalatiphilum TaxID=980631 RepID=A0A917FCG1_9HYPH|nr:hypothetical protein GCM10007301_22100 [Azorhizobium oxalatiphilum]